MTNQLTEGLELLLVGMGIVFLFLALLVVAVTIMSRLVLRFLPEKADLPLMQSGAGNDHSITAAISAAVYQYRAKYKQNK